MTEHGTGRDALEAERDFLLEAIRRLDGDLAAGRITVEEHAELRDEHTVRAAAALRALAMPVPVTDVEPVGEVMAGVSNRLSPQRRAARPRGGRQLSRSRVVWVSAVALFVAVAAIVVGEGASDRTSADAITGTVDSNSNALLRKAAEYTSKGDATHALEAYTKVIERDPTNVEALTYAGWLVRLQGAQLTDQAKRDEYTTQGLRSIERALQVQPSYADAHMFRGLILLRDRNDPAGAIPELQAYLEAQPSSQMTSIVEMALQDARAQVAAAPK